MKRYSLLLLSVFLVACGGGGNWDSFGEHKDWQNSNQNQGSMGGGDIPPVEQPKPEQPKNQKLSGVYSGIIDGTRAVTFFVLDNKQYWANYTYIDNSNWQGLLKGTFAVEGNMVKSTDLMEFAFFRRGLNSATIDATVTDKSIFSGKINYAPLSEIKFSTNQQNVTWVAANSNQLEGDYQGSLTGMNYRRDAMALTVSKLIPHDSSTVDTRRVRIRVDENCEIMGNMQLVTTRDYYQLDLAPTVQSTSCLTVGSKFNGMAWYKPEQKELTLMAVNTQNTDAILYIGQQE